MGVQVQRPVVDAAREAAWADHVRRTMEAQESGDLDAAAKLMSMAYLTFTEANQYAEQCNDLLEKHGLLVKRVKTSANNLMQSFDAYDKVMQGLLGGDKDANRQLCFDSDTLSELLDAFMANNIEVVRGQYYQAKLFLPERK